MDMQTLREWLISKGISAAELDEIQPLPVIDDIGNGLLLSLQNDDDIGNMLVMLMTQVDELNARIQALEANANA